MAASIQGNDVVDLSSFLPFSIELDTRRLTIEEAIAEEIYREAGQLDIQWGDWRKYGWRRPGRGNCVEIIREDDTNTGAGT
jgi:hypothetical protein